ncbi:MAG: class I SAM-dependent methyltransferase [Candidatus Obscuribacterales bacterium]|nr:class I SAM-dependent methyltransferase [Cyanobacteria bacterium HKST-UBA01]MCB9470215.1 class I SAM-dependent methyltransferase [Candidatus Obscuribacterales bacterium]
MESNPLLELFEKNQGRLIDKWTHYFDIYHRHFARFRNKPVKVLEIGVFKGGSLAMWRKYFGPQAKIFGVDIDPVCKDFEEDGIKVIIGDQEDRTFLRKLVAQVGALDIVIDDGGHTMKQQINSFEELYPKVKPGGVYLAEDLHTSYWSEYGGGLKEPDSFIEYSKNLVDQLNAWHSRDKEDLDVSMFTRTTTSMHYYNSVLVLEKGLVSPPTTRITGG